MNDIRFQSINVAMRDTVKSRVEMLSKIVHSQDLEAIDVCTKSQIVYGSQEISFR